MIAELDSVVLNMDMPEHGLLRGDIGVVALVHQEGAGYEIEFVALDGETVAVVTLRASQIRLIAHREIALALAVA